MGFLHKRTGTKKKIGEPFIAKFLRGVDRSVLVAWEYVLRVSLSLDAPAKSQPNCSHVQTDAMHFAISCVRACVRA